MSTLPSDYETLWVVVKAKFGAGILNDSETDQIEVEEQGYWERGRAENRASHLEEHDGVWASVFPVRFWRPALSPPPTPEIHVTTGVRTVGRGQELIAYGGESRPLRQAAGPDPDLVAAVSSAWMAWLSAQAERGNLDAIAQGGPSASELGQILAPPRGAPGEQLELPLPGLS